MLPGFHGSVRRRRRVLNQFRCPVLQSPTIDDDVTDRFTRITRPLTTGVIRLLRSRSAPSGIDVKTFFYVFY